MAWDATGKWIPDDKAATTVQEAAPVNAQTQQLSGLMNTTGQQATPPGAQTLTPGTTTTAAKTPGPQVNPGPGDIAGESSVATRLTGLLASDSPYMRLARTAGQRQAAKRGLTNSSIAGGASEAAAIAAAAPIASQDAAQAHQVEQTRREADLQLRNASSLQNQQDASAAERLNLELGNRITLQNLGDASAMERLIKQGGLEKALQDMRNDNALTQTQINANVSLLGNYMQAFATLSQNPELPSAARDSYMREFLRVTQSGQALVQALSGVTVTWPGQQTPTTPNPTPGPTPTGTSWERVDRSGRGGLLGLLNR